MAQNPSNMDMDMDTDILRERSVSSSNNSSRDSSTHSNASLVPYHKRMEIQSNNPLWSEQVEIEENERFSLSYTMPMKSGNSPVKLAIPKERDQCEINVAPTLDNTPAPQGESEAIANTNTCSSQEFENIPLPYNIYQPVEPNVWDSEAHLISIYSTMEFLDIDAKNMITSLLCIMNFIKSRKVD